MVLLFIFLQGTFTQQTDGISSFRYQDISLHCTLFLPCHKIHHINFLVVFKMNVSFLSSEKTTLYSNKSGGRNDPKCFLSDNKIIPLRNSKSVHPMCNRAICFPHEAMQVIDLMVWESGQLETGSSWEINIHFPL